MDLPNRGLNVRAAAAVGEFPLPGRPPAPAATECLWLLVLSKLFVAPAVRTLIPSRKEGDASAKTGYGQNNMNGQLSPFFHRHSSSGSRLVEAWAEK